MPSYKHTQPGGENKGRPSGQGQDKAGGAKPVNPNQTPEEHEELRKKHTEGPDQPASHVQTNNPNRNTDKTEIDNNTYN